jgi:DNA segregation ATPase FtsK/SpoIIIE-like protein
VKELLKYEQFKPIFVTADEYATVAEQIGSYLIEIAERGRSFDIHDYNRHTKAGIGILDCRIKANLLTKVSFKTTTESNSRIILDVKDTFHLPPIQGKAILQRAENMQIQVPYLSTEKIEELLVLTPTYN